MLFTQKSELEQMRADAMTRQGDVEAKEDEVYRLASPKGRFTSKAANALVDATNRLLPAFGVTDLYDKFTTPTLTELPPEFTRLLTMFSKAIDDGIEGGALPEDAKIDLAIVRDDSGLQSLAGRLGMAAKSGAFKRFLKTKVKEGSEEEPAAEHAAETPAAESAESTDTLFAGRMY